MSSARWRAVLLIVAVVDTVTAVAAASGSEELNQALVLVEILKSGIHRRTPFPVTNMAEVLPLNYAVLGRAWPPPYDVSYHEYGGRGKMAPLFSPEPYYGPSPQRRYENGFVEGVSPRQRFANTSRQFESDYVFGAQPGGYGQENETERLRDENQVGKTPLMLNRTETPMVTSSNMEMTDTTIKSETTEKKNTDAEKETTKTVVQGSDITVKENMEDTAKEAIDKTTATNSSSPAPDKILNHQTNENVIKTPKRISGKAKDQSVNDGNELEVAQAAKELEREAIDLRERSQRPKYLCRTTKSDHSKATLCLGGARVCKQEKTQLSVTVRFRGTTRVYLSRSSRPAIPLPENNAYCFTNPESPLCRTFI